MITDFSNPLRCSRFTHPGAFTGKSSWVKLVSLLVLLLLGWLDYITGYEFGFFIFYFIPVAISAWYCGRLAGIEIAVASALVWYMSDKYTFHPYSKAYFIYWELFMRLLSFLTTAMTLARIREMVLNEERLLKELLDTRLELESARNNQLSPILVNLNPIEKMLINPAEPAVQAAASAGVLPAVSEELL